MRCIDVRVPAAVLCTDTSICKIDPCIAGCNDSFCRYMTAPQNYRRYSVQHHILRKLVAMDFQLAFNGTYLDGVDDFVTVQTPSHFGIVVVVIAAVTATIYTILSPVFPTFDSS